MRFLQTKDCKKETAHSLQYPKNKKATRKNGWPDVRLQKPVTSVLSVLYYLVSRCRCLSASRSGCRPP